MVDFQSLAFSYSIVPESEIRRRISDFQSLLVQEGIHAALLLQLVDRFYFSGTIQDGVLIIPAEGDPRLLCRRSVERARKETCIDVVPLASLREVPLALGGKPDVLGLELDVIPAATFTRFSTLFPGAQWRDLGPLARRIRAVKSPYEIERIRAAALQVEMVMKTAREILSEGMREIDFASVLEKRARELGHQGILRMRGFNQELFYGHIISGSDSAIMSHLDAPSGGVGVNPSVAQGAGFRVIGKDEPVSVDFVGCVGGYLIDQTRLMVIGDLEEDLLQGFDKAVSIQDEIAGRARPGVRWSSLYEAGVQKANQLGVEDRFMGPPEEQVRFVGHGLGLEIDEYPFLAPRQDRVLEEGMVFAVEPKIFYPGKGITGIEDTFLLTEEGAERLTVTERTIIRV